MSYVLETRTHIRTHENARAHVRTDMVKIYNRIVLFASLFSMPTQSATMKKRIKKK